MGPLHAQREQAPSPQKVETLFRTGQRGGWISDWPKGRQLVYREGVHQHFDEYTDGGVQRDDAEGKYHLSDLPSVAMERLPGLEL